jgi:D-glycero-alpha-D-manno-heptose-7-phosphate kinase
VFFVFGKLLVVSPALAVGDNMYKVKSPMRFDLAGGTLDLWPIWAMLGNACTVNVSISLYTECEIIPLSTQKIEIVSEDFKKEWSFESLNGFLASTEPDLLFYQAHIKHWMPKSGFRMITRSESPVGGGLGGSSSLSISVYKAFAQWLGSNEDIHQVVRACSNIEAFILKTPTGTQDYYGAASQGLNVIDFDFSGAKLQTLQSHRQVMADKLMVVYTGKSHHSGINNWQVLKKYIDGDSETRKALESLQQTAFEMRKACLAGGWEKIPKLFAQEFEARLLLADSFVSPEILKLKNIADQNGAEGFKICGAGGGGCVGLWLKSGTQSLLKQAIEKSGFRVLDVQIL